MRSQFTGHAIKPNHSTAIPRYIIAVDTETVPHPSELDPKRSYHRFRLGVAKSIRLRDSEPSDEKVFRFTDRAKFWDWLYRKTKPNYTVWLVAHNALFDLRILDFPKEMTEARLVLDAPRRKRDKSKAEDCDTHHYGICCLDGPPTIIGLRNTETNGRIVIVDTLNWLKSSLADIGTAIGKPKMQMPTFDRPDTEWFDYCENDVDITLEAMVSIVRYVKDNDFGMFRFTAAGQAMSAFRHRMMPTKIFVHDDMDCKELERRGYFGGRTEVFRMGQITEGVWQLDVNSLFPSVMATQQVPIRIEQFYQSKRLVSELPDINWARSIADVCVIAKKGQYPQRTDSGTVYPRGSFRTTLAGQELRLAADNREILGIASWATYDCAVVFREYVDELWRIRRNWHLAGNPMFAKLTKVMLNSLYGKFGQKSEEWTYRPDMFAPDFWASWPVIGPDGKTVQNFRSVGCHVFEKVGKLERSSSFPAICAFITAAARLRMNGLRAIAGPKNVFYQAVDSVVVNKSGFDNLTASGEIVDDTLGKLRLDHTSNFGVIHGCNDYQLGDKVVISGVCGRHSRVEFNTFRHRKFSSVEGLFNSNPQPEVADTEQLWTRYGIYDKGTVGSDGWVTPLDRAEQFIDGQDWAKALSSAS